MSERIFLEPFFHELNSRNIRYCVLRNYDLLPVSTNGSDVDMWVHSEDVDKCIEALKKACECSQMQLVTYYGDSTALKVGFQNTHAGIQIDIFKGAVYYKNRILADGNSILDHIENSNGIKVMSKSFADMLALLKEMLNNNSIKEKYLSPIYEDSKLFAESVKTGLLNFGKSFVCALSQSILGHSIAQDLKKLRLLAKKTLSSKGKVSAIRMKLNKILRLLGACPGFVIVVEGTDGSGKSFIIDSITPILNGSFHNGVIYNHLRPNWLPDIAVVLGKRKKTSSGESVKVVSDPHAGKQSGFVMSLIRWGWYMLDYTFGYMRKVWFQIHSKSKVFIFDRYYYEFYLDQKRSHAKLPNWVVRIGELFLPKPDLILCLGGDPEKIFARKPETSLEEVTRQTNALKDFCKKRKNAVWIDTTMKPEESVEAAMKAIMAVMGKRFKLEDIQ